nr:hypothetical protein [Tanacetum cinerariifolium]
PIGFPGIAKVYWWWGKDNKAKGIRLVAFWWGRNGGERCRVNGGKSLGEMYSTRFKRVLYKRLGSLAALAPPFV